MVPAFDAVLEGSGHAVEARGERGEVGVGGRIEAGVELAGGERLCGEADLAEGGERSPRRPRTECG